MVDLALTMEALDRPSIAFVDAEGDSFAGSVDAEWLPSPCPMDESWAVAMTFFILTNWCDDSLSSLLFACCFFLFVSRLRLLKILE